MAPQLICGAGPQSGSLEFSRIAIMLYHVPGMEYGRTIFNAANTSVTNKHMQYIKLKYGFYSRLIRMVKNVLFTDAIGFRRAMISDSD